jgi:hypothetical protein
MILAIDFDDTLFHYHPEWTGNTVGAPIEKTHQMYWYLRRQGHTLILWTCREDLPGNPALAHALEACARYGLRFDAVNEHAPGRPPQWPNSRKVYADVYLDDRGCRTAEDVYLLPGINQGR